MKQLNLKFRDWFLIGVILLVFWVCCVSCTTSRPRPPQLPTVASVLQLDSLLTLPDSLPAPRPTILQRVAAVVRGGKAKSKVKFNGPTTIVLGNDNVATAATKPGAVAAGAGSVATETKKVSGPLVVGDGNQAASSGKGPAAAGEGITQTTPPPSMWPWLLGGVAVGLALRQFGPSLLKRLLLRI